MWNLDLFVYETHTHTHSHIENNQILLNPEMTLFCLAVDRFIDDLQRTPIITNAPFVYLTLIFQKTRA